MMIGVLYGFKVFKQLFLVSSSIVKQKKSIYLYTIIKQLKQTKMKNFIIIDRSQKDSISFVSNFFKISGLSIPQISKNPKNAKSFSSRDEAQSFLEQFIDSNKNFFII